MNGHGIQLGSASGRHRDMVLWPRVRHGRHAVAKRPWLVPCAIVFRDTAKTPSVKVVEREQTNTGSHGAHPGTPRGALGGRFRAPTATDGADENPPPGVGKGRWVT